MNTSEILAHIDDEIDRLQKVKALLTGNLDNRKSSTALAPKATKKAAPAKKQMMSAEGRARIAAAQKARWAKARRAA
jgi:hypothetical protein